MLSADEWRDLVDKSNAEQKPKRRRTSEEASIQKACVRWFRLQYPDLAPLLFSVPNGGTRNKKEAAELKRQGVVPGVADLILLVASKDARFSSLCLELKRKVGWQSESQISWGNEAQRRGNRYEVVRSIEEFVQVVNEHVRGI